MIYDPVKDFFTEQGLAKLASGRGSVQFDHLNENFCYFELKILKGDFPVIGIGLAPYDPLNWGHKGMVGWGEPSIAFHADDGLVFNSSPTPNSNNLIEKCTKGDVMGIFWDRNRGDVFFTKNGKRYNSSFVKNSDLDIIPTISIKNGQGTEFSVNLDVKKCVFDVFAEMKRRIIFDAKSVVTYDPSSSSRSEKGGITDLYKSREEVLLLISEIKKKLVDLNKSLEKYDEEYDFEKSHRFDVNKEGELRQRLLRIDKKFVNQFFGKEFKTDSVDA